MPLHILTAEHSGPLPQADFDREGVVIYEVSPRNLVLDKSEVSSRFNGTEGFQEMQIIRVS